jgi:hypothetical protein
MTKQFATREALYSYLRENKTLLVMEKKGALKFADAITSPMFTVDEEGVVKELGQQPMDTKNVKVSAVINTTNLMDSHSDVHIPGLWKKSLSEIKSVYLLQEHKMEFDKIISDQVKARATTMTWKELGYDYEGSTQALIFDAMIEKERSPYMAEQYMKNRVRNHSVGMRYVNLMLAMDSDSKFDAEEKATWNKYIKQVANREAAEEQGYFWVVTEAKIIEGSAVPMGSNWATPTLSIEEKQEPAEATPQEPVKITPTGFNIFKFN